MDNEPKQKTSIRSEREPTAQRPPRSVFIVALGLLVWLVIPWAMFLGTGLRGELIFIVCVLITVIGFGVCWIIVTQVLHQERDKRQEQAFSSWKMTSSRWLATYNGRLPMRAAALQILLIPGAVAIGFTLLALIDVIVRT